MIKIKDYYVTFEDLNKAEEPYRSLSTLLDTLYMPGPNGRKELSYQKFKNIYAISCIRDIAEYLSKNHATFVSQFQSLWNNLLSPNKTFNNSFSCYGVPSVTYQSVIFGGVYYVLSVRKSVPEDKLKMLEDFVTQYPEAIPYFNFFKEKSVSDETTRETSMNNSQDIAELRKQFINSLNIDPQIVDKVDWADATNCFDKDVMTEIFWGVVDDEVLREVCKKIISTWNECFEKNDKRCLLTSSRAYLSGMQFQKFDGVLDETIEEFFNNMWMQRKVRNTYVTGIIDKNIVQRNKGDNKITIEEPQRENEKQSEIKNQNDCVNKEYYQNLIASLKNDLQAFSTRDKNKYPLFTVKQIVIFIKVIFLEFNSLTNNAKNLAPLIQRFGGGFAPTTSENALGYEISQEECDELGDIFKEYAPVISKIIKQYPKKFKPVKSTKLQKNLKSYC